MRVPVAPQTCQYFSVVSVLIFGHSSRCVVISHYCFNMHFPDDFWCRVSFCMLICHLHFCFSGVSIMAFGPFFISCFPIVNFLFLFSYCEVLRILFIFLVTVLYLMWLLQIYFPSQRLVLLCLHCLSQRRSF